MIEKIWQYSLTLYERPGVARAAISLQDLYGADVNVLLFCCYAARARRSIDATRLHEDLAPWRTEVTGRLRGVRRRLKAAFPLFEAEIEPIAALRKKLSDLELDSERIALAVLSRALQGAPYRPESTEVQLAALHLVGYLRHLGVTSGGDDLNQVAAILGAATGVKDPAQALLEAGRNSAE